MLRGGPRSGHLLTDDAFVDVVDLLSIDNDRDFCEIVFEEDERRSHTNLTAMSPVMTAGEHPPCRDIHDGELINPRSSTSDEPGVHLLITALLWQRVQARTAPCSIAVSDHLPLLVPLLPGIADFLVVEVFELFSVNIHGTDLKRNKKIYYVTVTYSTTVYGIGSVL